MGLSSSQEPVTQTFTAGATGILSAVEVSLQACNGTSPTASVQLQIIDAGGNVLGATSLATAQLGCSSGALDADSVTGALFDLTASCIPVTSGQQLAFSLTVVDSAAATCDPSSHMCPNGRFCFADQECQSSLNVSMTGDVYAGGTLRVEGNDQGYDATFKTFVQ